MNIISKLSPFIICITMSTAHAVPVMNMNTPGAMGYTLYPDHENPNLFYIAPNELLVATNSHGVPQFSFAEYWVGNVKEATVQVLMQPSINESAVEQTMTTVRAINPSAQFTSLPFIESNMVFEGSDRLVRTAHCGHGAGQAFDPQACTIDLNHRGRRVLRHLFRRGTALTVQFRYVVRGATKNIDGSFSNNETSHQLSGVIGGSEIGAHPELFRDHWGRIINGPDEG